MGSVEAGFSDTGFSSEAESLISSLVTVLDSLMSPRVSSASFFTSLSSLSPSSLRSLLTFFSFLANFLASLRALRSALDSDDFFLAAFLSSFFLFLSRYSRIGSSRSIPVSSTSDSLDSSDSEGAIKMKTYRNRENKCMNKPISLHSDPLLFFERACLHVVPSIGLGAALLILSSSCSTSLPSSSIFLGTL